MSDTAGCEYSLSLGKFLNSSSLSFLDYKIVSNNNFCPVVLMRILCHTGTGKVLYTWWQCPYNLGCKRSKLNTEQGPGTLTVLPPPSSITYIILGKILFDVRFRPLSLRLWPLLGLFAQDLLSFLVSNTWPTGIAYAQHSSLVWKKNSDRSA